MADKNLFAPEDLLEKKNIPKVARCLASCVDLVRKSSVSSCIYVFAIFLGLIIETQSWNASGQLVSNCALIDCA